ncbi:hypothetical protein [Myxococcus sp. RHSTA-1-4]|uniref:hypothetical protein n=1 Tax=Myxococcus sp. RHSTA-1-4 TaxID=2874601 RepID=UPI001CC1958D|nr:hypothetical protein [Myxococcus sp. RHSTA-1-4]MBZ4417292.1 hypothetical protein [Myxococcus sp. RHSTA-1-4]
MIRFLLMAVFLLPTASLATASPEEPLPNDSNGPTVGQEPQPVETPEAPAAGTPRVDEPPAAALPPPAPVRPALSFAEAKEQYELRHIGFDDYVAMTMNSWTMATPRTVARWSIPYEGKYKKPLEGEAFYQKLGRTDLVEAYQGNMRKKILIGVAGGAMVVGGGVLALGVLGPRDEDCSINNPGFSACVRRNIDNGDKRLTMAMLGIGLGAAGAGVMAYAVWRTPHPIAASEARELADGYNKQLRAELGLSDEPAPAPLPRKRPGVIQASLTPTVGPGGGGLLLNAVF